MITIEEVRVHVLVVAHADKVSAVVSVVSQETNVVVMRVVRRDSIASKGYVALQINRQYATAFAAQVLVIRMVLVVNHPAICAAASAASESAAMGSAVTSASTATRRSAFVVPTSVALVAARRDNSV
jgi:hypothetical protein